MSVSESASERDSKLQQFNEFFSIENEFTVNLIPLDADQVPDYHEFMERIPLPFKISSDISSVDQSALRPLQGLSGVASHLVDFLNHQAQKIDLLVGYILSQQDDEKYRYQGIKFGGGGIIFAAPEQFDIHQMLEMKMFFLQDHCAVFCLGEIIDVERRQDTNHYKVIFHYIRDEDREVLVRTSLHEQSKQLQLLAQQRNKQSSSQ
ncbi:PilZ domain-containing protein [Thalassomonas viridans]|uniref:PilZ domain-containing protein n=1 Tax=Thalassomonas viridans TaxID=137584 RepID=A0AAF0CAG3_9GAMM|nr:PilZ domain-containing protein [Thalassomonas viridans]WDE06838.1 PilZ domain-containing protein [Thalassomonas viridans]